MDIGGTVQAGGTAGAKALRRTYPFEYSRNNREAGTVGVERFGGRMVGDECFFSSSSFSSFSHRPDSPWLAVGGLFQFFLTGLFAQLFLAFNFSWPFCSRPF